MILALIDEARRAGARLKAACEALGLTARTLQRWRLLGGGEDRRQGPKKAPSNKLSAMERQRILETLNSPQYCDLSPHQIVPLLADEGQYLASESTMYRLLREAHLLAHRQPSRPPTQRSRPHEYCATGPGQVLSWDITYLKGPIRGMFFYLYLILDVWSRKILGAKVYAEEDMAHAAALFEQTCLDNDLGSDVVLHSDNGGPMKGSTMLATLQRLGVIPSFSRPRVSDDNPYSEALFRTLKYRPEYPSCFESLDEANRWLELFVNGYNYHHLHSALRFITPNDRHEGRQEEILEQRRRVYQKARLNNPQRWAQEIRNWAPIQVVYLNPQKDGTKIEAQAA